MISHSSDKCVTCTIVGDGMVGKTQICQTFAGRPISEEYRATVTDDYIVHTQIMGDKYTIRVMDTSGQHDYQDIRTKSYKESDVFIVCYSLTDRDSFESVDTFWMSEIRKHCKKTPIILVATGIEARDQNNNVTKQEGLELIDKLGVDTYVECLPSNTMDITDLFEDVVISTVKTRKRRRSSLLRSLLAM